MSEAIWSPVANIVWPHSDESDTLPLYLDFGRSAAPIGTALANVPAKQEALVEALLLESKNQSTTDYHGVIGKDEVLQLPPALRVSLATVFNAFPASYWQKWTVATKVRLTLIIDGVTNVIVYKSNDEGRSQRVDTHRTHEGIEEVAFELPLDSFLDGGWYWCDLVANKDGARLLSGRWEINAEALRPATISIGITTFNRPDYCAKTLKVIAEAENLRDVVKKVYVVDQGNQKVHDDELFPYASGMLGKRLRMIDQGNLGGSGGFSRGMYEAVKADEAEFHLLLDDDVLVEPESIERLVRFASFCRQRTIVGGQMFDLNDKSVAHSFGEGLNRWRWLWGPIQGTSNRVDLSMANLRRRSVLHKRLDVDYNGWWMELIPVSVIKEIGLSLPIFIKWDDLEYGLRAQSIGVSTVTLPGAGLWHISWLDKDDSRDWQAYFHERNRILTALLHSPYDRGGRLLYELTTMDVKHAISAEYYADTIRLMAVEDILSGPEHLHRSIGETLPILRGLTKEFSDAQYKTDPNDFPPVRSQVKPKFKTQAKAPRMRNLLPWTLRTVLRQLTPPEEMATQNPEASISHAASKYYMLSQYDSALVTKADGSGLAWYRRDPDKLRALLTRSATNRSALLLNWSKLSEQYRNALHDLVSMEAWEKTFGIVQIDDEQPAEVSAGRS